MFVSFSNKAVECFLRGDLIQKRLILETVGSNLSLSERMLSIVARKPFVQWDTNPSHSELCTTTHDVRTFLENEDEGFAQIISNIKKILSVHDDGRRAA